MSAASKVTTTTTTTTTTKISDSPSTIHRIKANNSNFRSPPAQIDDNSPSLSQVHNNQFTVTLPPPTPSPSNHGITCVLLHDPTTSTAPLVVVSSVHPIFTPGQVHPLASWAQMTGLLSVGDVLIQIKLPLPDGRMIDLQRLRLDELVGILARINCTNCESESESEFGTEFGIECDLVFDAGAGVTLLERQHFNDMTTNSGSDVNMVMVDDIMLVLGSPTTWTSNQNPTDNDDDRQAAVSPPLELELHNGSQTSPLVDEQEQAQNQNQNKKQRQPTSTFFNENFSPILQNPDQRRRSMKIYIEEGGRDEEEKEEEEEEEEGMNLQQLSLRVDLAKQPEPGVSKTRIKLEEAIVKTEEERPSDEEEEEIDLVELAVNSLPKELDIAAVREAVTAMLKFEREADQINLDSLLRFVIQTRNIMLRDKILACSSTLPIPSLTQKKKKLKQKHQKQQKQQKQQQQQQQQQLPSLENASYAAILNSVAEIVKIEGGQKLLADAGIDEWVVEEGVAKMLNDSPSSPFSKSNVSKALNSLSWMGDIQEFVERMCAGPDLVCVLEAVCENENIPPSEKLKWVAKFGVDGLSTGELKAMVRGVMARGGGGGGEGGGGGGEVKKEEKHKWETRIGGGLSQMLAKLRQRNLGVNGVLHVDDDEEEDEDGNGKGGWDNLINKFRSKI